MQKSKLVVSALMMLAISSSYAADEVKADQKALSQNEMLIESPDKDSAAKLSTIGMIAQKQKRLHELELDIKIKEAEKKLNPPVIKVTPEPLPFIQVGKPPKKEDISDLDDKVITVSAIFGKAGDLRSEISFDGRTLTVNRGFAVSPTIRVDNIYQDHVTFSSGKKFKDVFVGVLPLEKKDVPSIMPPLPPVGR